jgi:hypothetical protein
MSWGQLTQIDFVEPKFCSLIYLAYICIMKRVQLHTERLPQLPEQGGEGFVYSGGTWEG